MSYFDDYNESRSKIPYDDIPITRNEKAQRAYGGSGRVVARMSKFSTIAISFLVILNIVLSVVCVYFLRNTKNRTINNYVIEMGASSEVSAAVKNTSLLSSICVAAGGTCNSESTFYSSTLSRGSGVIYSVDENSEVENRGTVYFVTCYHVVSGHDKIWVMMPSNLKPVDVSLLAYSSHYDIAVLKYDTNDIEGLLGSCTPVSVFDSVYVSFGERVFAIGNSLGSGLSITDGLISQVNAQIRIASNSYLTRTLQTSAEINPGNSGGGLFNASGKFIGLVNAKRHTATSGSETITVAGTSYAIPSSIVCGVVDKLIAGNKKPTRVNLGVTFGNYVSSGKTIELVEYDGQYRPIDKYSVVVESITPGSVAYRTTLRKGDIIESIEFYVEGSESPKRVKMYNQYVFDDYAFAIKEGTDIKIYIEDGNETSTTYVIINASSLITDSD